MLTRLEPTTGCSHLATRPETVLLSLAPHALPNRKLPSGYHFKSRRLEMAMAFCLALPKSPWEGRFSGWGGTSGCALPVRQVHVPPWAGGGGFRRKRTSGALSPASTWATDPRVKGAVSKLEWGRGGPAPTPDPRCRRSQDRTWPRT